MGGKGRKRREKNYRAAHGGHTRLPPPPDPSKVDSLPSKLRQIMSFASRLQEGSAKLSKPSEDKRKQGLDRDSHAKEKHPPENPNASVITVKEKGDNLHEDTDNGDETMHDSRDGKRRKKRKRKQVEDLRFDTVVGVTKVKEKRRERKKKYLEAKKKHKKSETVENLDFPGREQIKFGDVVQAPPKLGIIPKVPKKVQDASKERLRLQAIESYRNRKGWTSRPGLQLPPPETTTSSM